MSKATPTRRALPHRIILVPLAGLLLSIAGVSSAESVAPPAPLPPPLAGVTRVPVVFSGGHETEGVDHGRPVILIAAALGVTPEVFRAAFSQVHPAGPGTGGPTDAEARQNKAALMSALAKYGVTDERLNEVSNYYRYPPGRIGLWRNQPAVASALVRDGQVIGFEVRQAGSGYTTPPSVSVPGCKDVNARAQLSFGKNMEMNGAVVGIVLVAPGGR